MGLRIEGGVGSVGLGFRTIRGMDAGEHQSSDHRLFDSSAFEKLKGAVRGKGSGFQGSHQPAASDYCFDSCLRAINPEPERASSREPFSS